MKKNNKKRLFEVTARLDKTFKPKLNEEIQAPLSETDDFLPITTPIGSEDDKLFTSIVNQGIDSHLEGFTKSNFDVKDTSLGKRRIFNFHKSEVPILLRRLEELGTEEAFQWKDDIENYDNNINEMEMSLSEQQTRPLYDIAQEIYQDWRPVHPYAKDYLNAMTSLNSIDDRYMFDSGREIVARFLSNANQWKGETAKRIKAELKQMLGLRENSRLNETGEWIGDEDDMAWMEALKSEIQKIESETGGKLKLIDVKGFDKYQGPYAIVNIEGRNYKIWTVGSEYGNDMLWIENYPVDNTSDEGANAGFMGTTEMIINQLENS